MNIWVIIGLAVIIVAIVFLSRKTGDEQSLRKRYMTSIAAFFEAPLQIPSQDVYRIELNYKGRDFVFEDIEHHPLENETLREGILKTKTLSKLVLNFTEKPRSTIRTDVRSAKDLKYGWAQSSKDIFLPKGLHDFSLFTNNVNMTNRLLADDKIVGLLLSYKCQGSRGHPIMPLEFNEGEILLKFHSPGTDLKPNLLDLQYNYTLLENYMNSINELAGKIDSLQKDTEFSRA